MKKIEYDIVIVEDNVNDAELMIRSLKKNNLANNLVVLEDGAEALDFMFCRGKYEGRDIESPPKVIFLDLKLPKVSGLEFLAKIKSDERTKRVPVVIVSSSKEDPDIKEAYALGANSYVVKPVDYGVFTETINKLGLYWLIVNEKAK